MTRQRHVLRRTSAIGNGRATRAERTTPRPPAGRRWRTGCRPRERTWIHPVRCRRGDTTWPGVGSYAPASAYRKARRRGLGPTTTHGLGGRRQGTFEPSFGNRRRLWTTFLSRPGTGRPPRPAVVHRLGVGLAHRGETTWGTRMRHYLGHYAGARRHRPKNGLWGECRRQCATRSPSPRSAGPDSSCRSRTVE